MKDPGSFKQEQIIARQPQETSRIDPLILLSLVKRNWYWFIITVLIAMVCVRVYIRHTMPVYLSSATIMINQEDSRQVTENFQLLQGLGLSGGMHNIQNQIMLLESRALTENTLKELPFEVEFYFKTLRNILPVYPEAPLKISAEGTHLLPKDTEFSIKYLGNNMVSLESLSSNYFLQKTVNFGDTINVNGGSFIIDCRDLLWLENNKDRHLCFIVHSSNKLVRSYNNRLNVELVSREGSILKLSLTGTNRAKDVDFINRHIEGFQAISLNRKNLEVQRRIQFIDDQLIGISDSLALTENRLQQFRSSHKIMDLSAQGQSLIGQITLLENERARLGLEANYYDYLADYLAKNESGETPIVPITMGIDDTGLARLVEDLASLQEQLSTRGAGEMNPLQRNLEQRVRSTKDALRETLNGLRRRNGLARSENQDQINRVNAQASALPVTERNLLGIERKFRLNDELYTFLLETRAEQELQKASNRSDIEAIDPADTRFSLLVSPNPFLLNIVALFTGLAIPLIVSLLIFMFNKKLKEEDIKMITNIPVVGTIPHNSENTNTVVFQFSNSSIAEAFRLLRSRLQFLTREAKAPVILITSSMPGDGKTFTSINLASVYSLLGKKTVLVGFDLRKPNISHEFDLSNDKGVSTWLIGSDNLDDIIQPTKYENLSVISGGPIPPNPAELTAMGKTEELIRLLQQRFDYIIIDTSPVGIVSDTLHLATLADASLIVVRSGQTIREIFENTLTDVIARDLKSLGIIINDIQAGKMHSYGQKYGYTGDKYKSDRKELKKGMKRKFSKS